MLPEPEIGPYESRGPRETRKDNYFQLFAFRIAASTGARPLTFEAFKIKA
jgi:hypothetical protein